MGANNSVTHFLSPDFFANSRETVSAVEPPAMTEEELLEWYMSGPQAFRRKHKMRILQLSRKLFCQTVLEVLQEQHQ